MIQTTVRRYAIGLVVFAIGGSGLAAQSAMPTNNILFNTRMVQFNGEAGTMFPVDIDNREYWLTAKHILTGRKTEPAGEVIQKSALLQVLDPIGEAEKWDTADFTVIDPGKDIDIVVLIPKVQLLQAPIPPLKVATGSFYYGGECSFLGFPYSNTWTATISGSMAKIKMPFIKHCYISGMITSGSISELVLDGMNNPGFSGGPVLYNTGPNQVVIGVIAAIHNEPGKVYSTVPEAPAATNPPNKQREDVVDLNTGIIIAFPLEAVVDAIKKNPIGQPLPN